MFVWQADSICGLVTNPQLKQFDYNIYVRSSSSGKTDSVEPLILWGPANSNNCQAELSSLDGLQKLHLEFEAHSKYYPDYNGSLFKSSVLGNYELLRDFPGSGLASELPADISKLLGQSEKFIGAYPPVQ